MNINNKNKNSKNIKKYAKFTDLLEWMESCPAFVPKLSRSGLYSMIVRLSKQKLLDVAFSKTSLRQKSVRISEQGRKILLVMGSDYPAVEASFVSVEETTKQNLEDSDLAQSIEYMILDCMEIEYEEVLPAQKKKLELAARKIIKKLLG